QIAYELRPSTTGIAAPDNGSDWIVGNTPGTLEEPDPTAVAPVQTTAEADPARFTLHPANIRAVRIQLTVRSLRQDVTQPAPGVVPPPRAPPRPPWAGEPLPRRRAAPR